MIAFLRELKRRKVIRVGAAYVGVGWALVQLVGELRDVMALPDWFRGTVVVALLVLFPLTLILAWALEITPDGVKVTDAAGDDASLPSLGAVDYALLVAMLGLIGLAVFQLQRPAVSTSAAVSAPSSAASVAVLPFDDLSADGDQAYFSDGLAEELLNVLARVNGLRVASRTSSFSFKGSTSDVTEIARLLNVSHVLEGSVRKAGDRVRITAKLTRAEDGFHVWSQTYDRTLDDIFAIQDDVSNRILQQLRVEILGEESVRVARANVSAYDLFLRAREVGDDYSVQGHERAIALYREAIDIDPDYAAAYRGLASSIMLNSNASGGQGERPAAEALAEAWPVLEQAAALEPEHPGYFRALALFHQFSGEVDKAEAAYLKAADLQSNIELNNYAVLLRQQDRLDESTAVLERERDVNPRSVAPRYNLVHSYLTSGRLAEARREAEAMLDEFPDSTGLFSAENAMAAVLAAEGRWADGVRAHEAVLAKTPGVLPVMASAGFLRLGLYDYDGVQALGFPPLAMAGVALSGQPKVALAETRRLIDNGFGNPGLYSAAIYYAGLAQDWSYIVNEAVPVYPAIDGRAPCMQSEFPRDLVAFAYSKMERFEEQAALIRCWQELLEARSDNGFGDAQEISERAMLAWAQGDTDTGYTLLSQAIDQHANDPAMQYRMAMSGMLDEPRGRALWDRYLAKVNAQRAVLGLDDFAVDIDALLQ